MLARLAKKDFVALFSVYHQGSSSCCGYVDIYWCGDFQQKKDV